MENLYNSIDIFTELGEGKEVVCPKCGKGKVVPVNRNIDPKDCHGFYCDNQDCNYTAHWDPVVIVE